MHFCTFLPCFDLCTLSLSIHSSFKHPSRRDNNQDDSLNNRSINYDVYTTPQETAEMHERNKQESREEQWSHHLDYYKDANKHNTARMPIDYKTLGQDHWKHPNLPAFGKKSDKESFKQDIGDFLLSAKNTFKLTKKIHNFLSFCLFFRLNTFIIAFISYFRYFLFEYIKKKYTLKSQTKQ